MTSGRSRRSIGNYQVLAKLSAGGMGEVLLARRMGAHGFEKLAAIKTIRANLGQRSDLVSMFKDEARLMARLNHPGVAQVYDFVEEGNRLFLIMEYVAGVSFDRLIQRRPPPLVCARAMAEVCRGLDAAHRLTDLDGRSLGVVHRDVSPQNLMLTFDGWVKILDFGIALVRDRETAITQCGQVRGKPAYMSPEQVTNGPIDRRSDVFTAAIVLHEMLTGKQLFSGDSILATARAIERAEVSPPSRSLGAKLPAGLDQAVLKGLGRDPSDRFQSAMEMAAALDRLVNLHGGETLEDYARRELAPIRDRHLEELRKVLSDTRNILQVERQAGRPEGVGTIPLGNAPDGARSPGDEMPPAEHEAGKPSGKRWLWTSLVLLLLLVGIGIWSLLDRFDWRTYATDSSGGFHAIPAGPPPAQPVVLSGSQDAGGGGLDLSGEEQPVATGEPDKQPTVAGNAQTDRPMTIRKRPNRVRPRRKKSPSGPVSSAKVKPFPEDVEPGSPPPAADPKAFGFITVAAEPYALVRIDGKQAGTTPIFRRKLPVGIHEVVLINPATGEIRQQRRVDIARDGHEKVILKPDSEGRDSGRTPTAPRGP